MAQPIEKADPIDMPRGSAKVVLLPASTASQETPFEPTTRVEGLQDQVASTFASTIRSLRPAFEQARVATSDACVYVFDESRDAINRMRNRVEQIKQEHPLELLYGITAGAFVLGMALRIWRAKRS
jgi:hypothetical protein